MALRATSLETIRLAVAFCLPLIDIEYNFAKNFIFNISAGCSAKAWPIIFSRMAIHCEVSECWKVFTADTGYFVLHCFFCYKISLFLRY